jgi:hypothetical protein
MALRIVCITCPSGNYRPLPPTGLGNPHVRLPSPQPLFALYKPTGVFHGFCPGRARSVADFHGIPHHRSDIYRTLLRLRRVYRPPRQLIVVLTSGPGAPLLTISTNSFQWASMQRCQSLSSLLLCRTDLSDARGRIIVCRLRVCAWRRGGPLEFVPYRKVGAN